MTDSATGRFIPAYELRKITSELIEDIKNRRSDMLYRLQEKMLAWEREPSRWYTFPLLGFGFVKSRTDATLRQRLPGRYSLPADIVDRYVFGTERLTDDEWKVLDVWEPFLRENMHLSYLRPRDIKRAGEDLMKLCRRIDRVCRNADGTDHDGTVYISSHDWDTLVRNDLRPDASN